MLKTVDPRVGVPLEHDAQKRKKKRRKTVAAAISSSAQKRPKKNIGPITSDRDSGVMGRLRAAGANSLFGRNILGAYPGDALPPTQAGDPRGLLDLAQKYGYGDWSDDGMDDVDEFAGEVYDERPPATKLSRKRSKTTKRTKQKGSSKRSSKKNGGGGISIGFSIGSDGSSMTAPPRSDARLRMSDLQQQQRKHKKRSPGLGDIARSKLVEAQQKRKKVVKKRKKSYRV